MAEAWMLDLDGVLWRGKEALPGSAEAVARIRAAGHRVRAAGHRVGFLTNNSYTGVADQVEKLVAMGVPAEPDDVCTSGQAAAGLLEPGSTVLVVGGLGITEAMEARGIVVVGNDDGESADAVVVGFDPTFDYKKLSAAFRAVSGGARLIGTNDDATFPTASRELPGGGSIVAAVAYASGVKAEIAGKPNAPAGHLLVERLGEITWLVGDRPDTDGGMAVAIGARFGLVLSGVTSSADGADPKPDAVAPDLATLVQELLSISSG